MSSSSLVFLLFFILISLGLNTAQFCYKTGNFTVNSTYGENRNLILSSLASNVKANGGFYTGPFGQGPDTVYALGLCRGDLTEESCFNCINSTSNAIMKKCTNQIDTTDFGNPARCIVRSSNKSFLGATDTSPAMAVFNTMDISTNLNEFDQAFDTLVDTLVITAAKGSSRFKFATDIKNFTENSSIYALMECTPGQLSLDCTNCLRGAVSDYQLCCMRKRAVVILRPSCIFQYDLSPFFEITADASPPPPLPAVTFTPPPSTNTTRKEDNRSRTLRITIAAIVPTSMILLVLIGYAFFRLRKREIIKNSQPDIPSEGDENIDLPIFSVVTIAEATNNFSSSNKIGEGGFGPVFKGELSTGQLIAVKRNSEKSKQGLREFKNEVVLISKLQHRNLVRLLGCCIQGEERMLIYEYMPNGSLDSFIFDNRGQSLTWSRHFNIIVGIARGLLYLHRDSRLRIIHRDLKASNVLLDSEMNPKIADFGIARAFRGDQLLEKTARVIRTHGYMSPEYVIDGLFSIKSDVFSFGVLVLEIVSGWRNREFRHPDHGLNLLGHAWNLWIEGKALELVPEQMIDSFPIPEILKCIQVGLLCVQQHPEDRPTMSLVLLALDSESAVLPQPKQPGFYTERGNNESEIPSAGEHITVNNLTLTALSGR